MIRRMMLLCLLLSGAAICLCQFTSAQNPLPPDAKATCTVTPQQFASWFASGSVTPNGLVKPADSVGFTLDANNPHCSFYQWSEQMFLWLTSPGGYEGKGHVFDSSIFYDVSPSGVLTQNGTKNTPLRSFAVRSAQLGPRGRLLKVNRDGSVSDTTGQAGGNGTLLAQNDSLVYYSTEVNDVYAYFKTGSAANAFNPPITTFPTTQAQLAQIEAFAKKTFPDGIALTMELKFSWVEAATLKGEKWSDEKLGKYITTTAYIPVYDFSKPPQVLEGAAPPSKWTPPIMGWMPKKEPKKATMALVGLHVVGTVKGHPEMVWATFEHVDNAPNGPYSYTAANGTTKQVPQSTAPPPSGEWLFCANNFSGTPNTETLVTINNATTKLEMGIAPSPNTGTKAVPSSTIRSFAWGGPLGNGGVVDNTEIIAINNAVIGMLGAGDIRKNYVMIGAVWTGGQIPPLQPPPPAKPVVVPPAAEPIGSVMLSNATMETYHQFSTTPFGYNCFSCHQGDPLNQLSHIFAGMKPLPK